MRVRVNVMLAAVKERVNERVNVEDEYDAGSESNSE
jgi:hypothetical protein